jgi:hypothetical protein
MSSDDLPLGFCSVRWLYVECVWNLMEYGDAWEGKWRGNWWMEWLASTLTLPQNMVYQALLPLTCTPRLPVVNWTDTLAYLSGLVCFAERCDLVSARVPSHFKHSLLKFASMCYVTCLFEIRNEGPLLLFDVSSLLKTKYIPFWLGCWSGSPGILNVVECWQPPPTQFTCHVLRSLHIRADTAVVTFVIRCWHVGN